MNYQKFIRFHSDEVQEKIRELREEYSIAETLEDRLRLSNEINGINEGKNVCWEKKGWERIMQFINDLSSTSNKRKERML